MRRLGNKNFWELVLFDGELLIVALVDNLTGRVDVY
jgi:hypothetical protein